jgi:putative endonuclease
MKISHSGLDPESTNTIKYGLHRLVYYEGPMEIIEAIAREKNLKNWKRQWKIELIEK